MKTIKVPTFHKLDSFKFKEFKTVKIKNNPNSKDYIKVAELLPGLAVGYCPEFYDIAKTKKPIEIIRFYDIRQRSVKKLKGYYITLI